MNNKLLLIGCLTLLGKAGLSQDVLTELTVDRPGFAETPYTLTPGVFQIETGFDYFKRYNNKVYNLPTMLLRAGLTKKSELRVNLREVVDEKVDSKAIAIAPFTIGIKRHIIEQHKGVPEIDILVDVVVPIFDNSLFSKKWGYEFLLLFENDFYPNSAINYNVGFTWDTYAGEPVFTANFCYNYLPSDRVGLFAEYFAFAPHTQEYENGIDAGITYLLKSNLQADLSSGYSLINSQHNVFVSLGLTVRL